MVMKALRQGAAGGISKFILFGFMVFAVGGLVFMDIGGFFRGGVSRGDIARAGNETISLSSFDRTVEMTLHRVGMSVSDAYKLGYINQILSAEIRGRLLNQAAMKTGIFIDRKRVAGKIKDIIAPMVGPGQNPQDVLHQVLANQGMNETMFVENMKRDMANSILAGAIQGGLQSDSIDVVSDLYRYQNEKRAVRYIAFPDSDMSKELPAPPEDKMRELYEATKENYATPELRTLKLITVKTDQLKKTLEISDEELRKSYDDNIDLYSTPAQWTLDQALLATEEQAKAVRAAVDKGQSLKNAVKNAAGGLTPYLGEKNFDKGSLLEEIKEDVLAAQKPGTAIGPVHTPLGWSVVIVSKISEARVKPFSEVKKEINDEMMANKLSDEQYALAGQVDDLFAGGASVDDVAKEVPLDVKTLPVINHFGQDKNGKDALKDYADLAPKIMEYGFSLEEGETSPVFEEKAGQFVAISVESVQPKQYKPFEDVKDSITKRWIADQSRITNQMRVSQILAGMGGLDNAIAEIAKAHSKQVKSVGTIGRQDTPQAPFTQRTVGAVFEAPVGLPIPVEIDGGFAIAIADKSTRPEKIDTANKDFKALVANLKKNNRDEGMILYLEQKRIDYGASVNKPLLDQRYGSRGDSK